MGLFSVNTKQRKAANVGQEVSADESKHSQASILRHKMASSGAGSCPKELQKDWEARGEGEK